MDILSRPEAPGSSLRRDILSWRLAQLDPSLRSWLGPRAEADLKVASANLQELLSDMETAADYAATLHVLALPPEAFTARLVTVNGVHVIARIDFTNVSGANPFVDVLASSEPLGSRLDGSSIARTIGCAFGAFRPNAVRFFQPAHRPLASPATHVECHVLAGRAGTMAAAQDHTGLTRVSLRQAPSLASFERYCEIYREVLDERPQLRGKLEAETRESLEECQSAGLLFDIAVDGDWQGLIALRPDHVLGIEFLLVVDIVLAKPARGAGLGVGVHCALARILAQNKPDAVFIGTIVPENEPSLLTARRAGRVEIGTYRRIVLT